MLYAESITHRSLRQTANVEQGLGRLVFDICKAGFAVEGNEISYHQLLANNWVLNHIGPEEKFELYPFALTFSNQLSLGAQLKSVRIPDEHPGSELNKSSVEHRTHAFDRMSMTAADFVVLYADDEHKGVFDVVSTVFFIDTAPNVIRYSTFKPLPLLLAAL